MIINKCCRFIGPRSRLWCFSAFIQPVSVARLSHKNVMLSIIDREKTN